MRRDNGREAAEALTFQRQTLKERSTELHLTAILERPPKKKPSSCVGGGAVFRRDVCLSRGSFAGHMKSCISYGDSSPSDLALNDLSRLIFLKGCVANQAAQQKSFHQPLA